MENRFRQLITSASFIGVLALIVIVCIFQRVHFYSQQVAHSLINESDEQRIKNGDLIFRRGWGVNSELVSSINRSTNYSHVGLVWKRADKIYVIHAIPDENGIKNGVVVEPLEVFASVKNASKVSVSRTSENPDMLKNIVNYALTFKGLPFDSDFDISQQDSLYCTELIWFSFKHFGDELIGSFDKFKVPLLQSSEFILIGTLQNGKGISEVFNVSS